MALIAFIGVSDGLCGPDRHHPNDPGREDDGPTDQDSIFDHGDVYDIRRRDIS